jgi:hypothetical protein
MFSPTREEEQRSMPYPLAYRTRRIVFLLALLFPAATLGYVALPYGDILLRTPAVTARTHDIQIGHQLPALPKMKLVAPPARLSDRQVGARTTVDAAAVDELVRAGASASAAATAYAPSVAAGASIAASGGTDADTSGGGNGRTPRRGNSSSVGYSGHMDGAGVWGGVAGITVSRRTSDGSIDLTPTTTQDASTNSSNSGGNGGGAAGGASGAGGTNAGANGQAAAQGQGGGASPGLTVALSAPGLRNTGPGNGRGLTTALGSQGLTAGAGGVGSASPLSDPPSPTPEPITFVLMGGGLAAAFAGRRFVR